MLSTADKAELQERLIVLQTRLATLEEAILTTLTGVQSYKLDTGETMQQTVYQDPKKLQEMIDLIKSQIDNINDRLNQRGVFSLNMRRR
jgi:hypothetical protein